MDDYLQEHLQAALKNASNLVESCKDAPERSTAEEKRSFLDKEGSTVDKGGYGGNKERSTVDNEGSTVDKEGSTVDMEDHGEVNKFSSTYVEFKVQ